MAAFWPKSVYNLKLEDGGAEHKLIEVGDRSLSSGGCDCGERGKKWGDRIIKTQKDQSKRVNKKWMLFKFCPGNWEADHKEEDHFLATAKDGLCFSSTWELYRRRIKTKHFE